MLKHNIAYTDFNGNEQQEDFHFHLSLPELTRIEADIGTDLGTHTKNLAENGTPKEMIAFLERIILTSYGKKTSDGRSFVKTKESTLEFEHSQAYAELFEQLLTDHSLAQKFGEGVAETSKSRQKKNQVAPTVLTK